MALAPQPRAEPLLSLAAAAAIAGVHRNTIRGWCTSGRLPSIRVNARGERQVRREDLAALIAARTEPPPASRDLRVVPDPRSRRDALRRFASQVSGQLDLDRLFDDVIDESFALFGVDEAGLWLYDDSETPFELAAQRGLSPEMLDLVAALPRTAPTAGLDAIRTRRVHVLKDDLRRTAPALREVYLRNGIRTICFVPVAFRDEPVGLLALYHHSPYSWSEEEIELARAFADHLATAVGNARLVKASSALADRLRAIGELAADLNRIQDVDAIAAAIVREARRFIDHETIRIYRVDRLAGMCEPIAFQGRFLGSDTPDLETLRVPIGTGLTGWAAEHNQTVRLGDAASDPRGLLVGSAAEPESMLIVPMAYQGEAHGVIVVSKAGRDQFDEDDERTVSIFASYAAHAMVNAANIDQLRLQHAELERRMVSQQRLLEVNERLLSTLEPTNVLDLIADSLDAIVPYDSLTIYRLDRTLNVRRAVVARDRFADLIMADVGPLDGGLTGWVIERGEAVLTNAAHLDPRAEQVPGTPFEPEAMIVVPLIVDAEVIGTLNISRTLGPDGTTEGFSESEFELTKLFAGQASIALRNAETHGAVRSRAESDSLTGLRNHGAFQRELGETLAGDEPGQFAVVMLDLDGFKAFNDACGHPAGDALLAAVARAMEGATRGDDRLYRYGGDEFAAILAGADRVVAHEVAERIRRAVALLNLPAGAPPVSISTGVACHPDDGVTKDDLVRLADEAMYLGKPNARRHDDTLEGSPYLRALDETADALGGRHDPATLLGMIVTRATGLIGVPHGYLCLTDPITDQLVIRNGLGLFAQHVGSPIPPGRGVAGEVMRSGKPFSVDDHDAYAGRVPGIEPGLIGAVLAVPIMSGGRTVGALGLASGSLTRTFGSREIDALGRFGQLASIALDNVRLFEEAQRGALYDPTTGLPNRELMLDRIRHALTFVRPDDTDPIAIVLVDLDRFRVINESAGHAAGDRLLAAIAQRLSDSLRPGDTVARFGGDEFGIILDSVTDAAQAERMASEILTRLRMPFMVGDREWFVGASVGIALARRGGATPDELLRHAEIAMVRAQTEGSGRPLVFEPSMSLQTMERVDLEHDLRGALERDELRVHYQPLVDLRGGGIIGFEALTRWQHPTRGLVAPHAFIPVAEETGLIIPLGRWVLETACRQAARWRAADPTRVGVFVSVNLSARQFSQSDLPDEVATVLAATGLPAGALELEITESALMDQTERGIAALTRLRALGVRLVLDDFGTGYSSLSYLRHLPLDTIKIDRSFVAGVDQPADRSIVEAVVALAHGLGIGVVAEGIETSDQLKVLRTIGCDVGQGFLFAAALPPDEATRLIAPPVTDGAAAAGS